MQRMTAGQKATSTGRETCKKVWIASLVIVCHVGVQIHFNEELMQVEGKDVKAACGGSCISACSAAFDKYATERLSLTGFQVVASNGDKDRLLRACSRQCTYECGKPGNGYGFAVPFRQ